MDSLPLCLHGLAATVIKRQPDHAGFFGMVMCFMHRARAKVAGNRKSLPRKIALCYKVGRI